MSGLIEWHESRAKDADRQFDILAQKRERKLKKRDYVGYDALVAETRASADSARQHRGARLGLAALQLKALKERNAYEKERNRRNANGGDPTNSNSKEKTAASDAWRQPLDVKQKIDDYERSGRSVSEGLHVKRDRNVRNVYGENDRVTNDLKWKMLEQKVEELKAAFRAQEARSKLVPPNGTVTLQGSPADQSTAASKAAKKPAATPGPGARAAGPAPFQRSETPRPLETRAPSLAIEAKDVSLKPRDRRRSLLERFSAGVVEPWVHRLAERRNVNGGQPDRRPR